MQKTTIAMLYLLLGIISLLVIITRGRNTLVRKKLLLGFMILSLSAPAAFLVSCKTGDMTESRTDRSGMADGWIDGDTFRIAVSGTPNKKVTNRIALRESSKRAAILNAQYQIIEKLRGTRIEACAGMSDFESTGIALAQEMKGIVKGGTIVAARWDIESNCEIIYEVKSRGLKQKVNAADFR